MLFPLKSYSVELSSLSAVQVDQLNNMPLQDRVRFAEQLGIELPLEDKTLANAVNTTSSVRPLEDKGENEGQEGEFGFYNQFGEWDVSYDSNSLDGGENGDKRDRRSKRDKCDELAKRAKRIERREERLEEWRNLELKQGVENSDIWDSRNSWSDRETLRERQNLSSRYAWEDWEDECSDLDKESLVAFGYDLFAGEPTTFSPITDIPVSSDYVIGPGDTLKVNLYGKESKSFELVVDHEGRAYIPDLGPISLVGLGFSEAKERVIATVDQKMIGVKAVVSMGELRPIRVFVLGEARVPGSYVVSALSTMTNALVLSGGVAETGSLRNIQLKRKGKLIQSLDVYDLLLSGDTSGDAQLQSGDVVFIPAIGQQVSITGEVKRPGYYELKEENTVADLLSYAGGMEASAYPQGVALERVNSLNEREFLKLDLTIDNDLNQALQNGDQLDIPEVLSKIKNVVNVVGHVEREASYRWKQGIRISDVVPRAEYLKSDPDLSYALIKRYSMPERTLSVKAFSLVNVLKNKQSEIDLLLHDQDEIIFFGLFEDRTELIGQLVDELRQQASLSNPSQEVSVTGNVRYSGVYPLVEGMTLQMLIEAAGGLTEKAYLSSAELNRTVINERQDRIQKRKVIALTDISAVNMPLQARDVLTVKAIPEWAETKQIKLTGEVKFPGIYPFHKNDTLADIVDRAGGLTEYAYTPGAVFTRVDLRKQQTQQLRDMQSRLETDIAKAKVVASNQPTATGSHGLEEAEALLEKLRAIRPKGRLVIDLEKVIKQRDSYVITLKDGDRLHIPEKKSSVTVIGEVQMPISQIFETGRTLWDYIEHSGGMTEKADDERIYIIKANGGVEIPQASNWFASASTGLAPGDTIVVPLDEDKANQIILWRDLSQIFYQVALGAAAVGSL
jgi:protein involved in polysaccharide export with SLBB domain